MLLVAACIAVCVAGLVAVAVWGGAELSTPEPAGGRSASLVARRYVWWVTVAAVGGLGAGLFAGVGGRLIMRLLAATSPQAQGLITEADEVVGVISLGGTLGLILFSGFASGVLSVLVYLLIRRWLPPGRLGGLTFGVLLLVLASTRIEPLRPDNIDFSLVGPGWLALSTFGLLVVLHGMLVAALVARFSQSLPLLATPLRTNDVRTVVRYWPLVLVVVLIPVAVLVLAVGVGVMLAFWLLPSLESSAEFWSSRRLVIVGRVLLGLVVVASLPGFVSAVSTILTAS